MQFYKSVRVFAGLLRTFLNTQRYQTVLQTPKRAASTSDKNQLSPSSSLQDINKEDLVKPRTWISYGFDREDEETDRNVANATFFFFVSLGVCGTIFCFTYVPDWNYRDWAQREAYLLLRHREENGLPLVDPNYVDPALIKLPSDEELKDVEIII